MNSFYAALHYKNTKMVDHVTDIYNNYSEFERALEQSSKTTAKAGQVPPEVQILSKEEFANYNKIQGFIDSWFSPNINATEADYGFTFIPRFPWPVLVVEDNDIGGKSVTNAALEVIKEIQNYTYINLSDMPIIYRDSSGSYSQIIYSKSQVIFRNIKLGTTQQELDVAIYHLWSGKRSCYDTSVVNLLNLLFATENAPVPISKGCSVFEFKTTVGQREFALTNRGTYEGVVEYWFRELLNTRLETGFIFSVREFPCFLRMDLYANEELRVHQEIDPDDFEKVELYNALFKGFLLKVMEEKYNQDTK